MTILYLSINTCYINNIQKLNIKRLKTVIKTNDTVPTRLPLKTTDGSILTTLNEI